MKLYIDWWWDFMAYKSSVSMGMKTYAFKKYIYIIWHNKENTIFFKSICNLTQNHNYVKKRH